MKNVVRVLALACALALVFGVVVRAADAPAKVAGKWEITWEGRNGTQTSTVTFEQDGEKLKGTVTSQFQGQTRESPLEGSVKGKEISFTVKRQTPRGELTQEFKGTVDGDTMKGTFSMGERTVDWTAKRAK